MYSIVDKGAWCQAIASMIITASAYSFGKKAGVKSIIAGTGATQTGNETSYTGGYWNNSASVTSISLLSSSGNFDAGTIYVYTSA